MLRAQFLRKELTPDIEHRVRAKHSPHTAIRLIPRERRLHGEIAAGAGARAADPVQVGFDPGMGARQVRSEVVEEPGPEVARVGGNVVAGGFGHQAVVGGYEDRGVGL